jgi:hypothetical protein
VYGPGIGSPAVGVGIGAWRVENAPEGSARDGVRVGSPPWVVYIDDNGRPARHRAKASWNSAADWKR